jgi:hypothetical protein
MTIAPWAGRPSGSTTRPVSVAAATVEGRIEKVKRNVRERTDVAITGLLSGV